MLKTPRIRPTPPELISLDALVPPRHPLRRLARRVSFAFVRDRIASQRQATSDDVALNPVVMFRLLFLGYLFGIRCDHALLREASHNIAYRWFIRLRRAESLPQAAAFTRQRRRLFAKPLHRDILEEIVQQAARRGVLTLSLSGSRDAHLESDADGSPDHPPIHKTQTLADYLSELDSAFETRHALGWKATARRRSGHPQRCSPEPAFDDDAEAGIDFDDDTDILSPPAVDDPDADWREGPSLPPYHFAFDAAAFLATGLGFSPESASLLDPDDLPGSVAPPCQPYRAADLAAVTRYPMRHEVAIPELVGPAALDSADPGRRYESAVVQARNARKLRHFRDLARCEAPCRLLAAQQRARRFARMLRCLLSQPIPRVDPPASGPHALTGRCRPSATAGIALVTIWKQEQKQR